MYRRYASKTSVSVEKSIAEIQRTLTRYGATAFIYGTREDKAVIQFERDKKQVRFTLPMPDKEQFKIDRRGRARSVDLVMKDHEQACRSGWRALALAVKAKLEAVEAEITTFEEEFLAYLVLPGTGGKTFGEEYIPQIESSYESGKKLPPLLPG